MSLLAPDIALGRFEDTKLLLFLEKSILGCCSHIGHFLFPSGFELFFFRFKTVLCSPADLGLSMGLGLTWDFLYGPD